MAKQIQIRIMPNGSVQAETKNIKGKQCLKMMIPIEQMLEAHTVNSEFTSEYYETEERVYAASLEQEVLNNGRQE